MGKYNYTTYKNSIWDGVPQRPNPRKGEYGMINYGGIHRRRNWGNAHGGYRKLKRQIRKYGFDLSEIWSLDTTIIKFLSDKFPETFRQVGDQWTWDDYDYDGKKIEYDENDDEWFEASRELEKVRSDAFLELLRNFLNNLSQEELKVIADFVSPRLRALAHFNNGWPSDDIFTTFESWINEIKQMADDFENGIINKYFIDYYYHLWW